MPGQIEKRAGENGPVCSHVDPIVGWVGIDSEIRIGRDLIVVLQRSQSPTGSEEETVSLDVTAVGTTVELIILSIVLPCVYLLNVQIPQQ